MDLNSRPIPGAPVSVPADSSAFLSRELRAILQSANRRLQSWQPPPNWSAADWSAECRQIQDIAASKMTAVLASGNGWPAQSIYNRLIASVRTRYRREWAYGLQFEARAMDLSDRDEEVGEPADGQTHEDPTYAALYEAMEELTKEQRFLIEQIFFLGRTETEIGDFLGISQRAVSKRKQSALKHLGESLRRVASEAKPPAGNASNRLQKESQKNRFAGSKNHFPVTVQDIET